MATQRAHDSRPGIEPGQILPLPEFLFRTRMSRTNWQKMRSQAEAGGHRLALKVGAKSFIDTTVFQQFLKASTAQKPEANDGVSCE